MNNLTLILLGLALSSTTYAKACFSQKLNPYYPCCKDDVVAYIDENGSWGIENGEWCGIGNGHTTTCFSLALGYPCCEGDTVFFTDESGNWGVENGEWCGIDGDGDGDDESCFSLALGYPCCKSCDVRFTSVEGAWGKENKQWCGLKDSCDIQTPAQNVTSTDFELSFLKMENKEQNMLYSPLSIEYALYMLKDGAIGETYDEIYKVVGDSELPKYDSISKILSLANGIFIKDKFYEKVKEDYMNLLIEKYNAEVKTDPFNNAKNINSWISNKTFGIIQNMISDEIFSKDTADAYICMFLINALAIEMEWRESFSFKSTSGEKFYKANGTTMTTTMMSKKSTTSNTSYYLDDDVSVFTLDLAKYKGTQLEFMVIMPNKEKLSSFVEHVTMEQIRKIDEQLTSASDTTYGVITEIPKFKFEYDLSLKEDLINLGVKKAFRKDANFTKMARVENDYLYVSDALHKANIEFSEEGIKAAAVTVIVMTYAATKVLPTTVRPTYPIIITIDKPFMFLIRDKTTKDIWFTGTVYEPNLWANDKEKYGKYY